MNIRTAVIIGIALAPIIANADVYKYVAKDGKVLFTTDPIKDARFTLEWHRKGTELPGQPPGLSTCRIRKTVKCVLYPGTKYAQKGECSFIEAAPCKLIE
jgi:hypothetical protein